MSNRTHIASLSNIDRFFGEVSSIHQFSTIWADAAGTQAAAE
jgi:hypothetical protein